MFKTTDLQKGRSYRVTGWIYVPGATGLSPQDSGDRGLRLVGYTRNEVTGVYTATKSQRPTLTDAWQQLTLDLTVPADADDVLVRLYNGFGDANRDVYFDDLSVREIWAPLGPQWDLGTADEAAGTAYTAIAQPSPDVAVLKLTGGGEIWFTGVADKWWPEPGACNPGLARRSHWPEEQRHACQSPATTHHARGPGGPLVDVGGLPTQLSVRADHFPILVGGPAWRADVEL
jgi:hypothetical protein